MGAWRRRYHVLTSDRHAVHTRQAHAPVENHTVALLWVIAGTTLDVLILKPAFLLGVIRIVVCRLTVVLAFEARHLHHIFLLWGVARWQKIGLRLPFSVTCQIRMSPKIVQKGSRARDKMRHAATEDSLRNTAVRYLYSTHLKIV